MKVYLTSYGRLNGCSLGLYNKLKYDSHGDYIEVGFIGFLKLLIINGLKLHLNNPTPNNPLDEGKRKDSLN